MRLMVPKCILSDNETPVFQNCPQQPIMVQKDANGGLLPVNFTEPTAVDNSGSIARLEVKPANFRTPIYVFQDTVVKYVAFDYDGNVAICEINITVPGTTINFFISWEKITVHL
jgi:hypothetical protein